MVGKKRFNLRERYGKWALVAGAASGIGTPFAEQIASEGMNLVLVDVQEAALLKTALAIRNQYNVSVLEVVLDLSRKESYETVIKKIEGLDCRLLIYIPAYSPVKPFLMNNQEELDTYIGLNAKTPLKLIHAFLKGIPTGESAGVILISSLAGILGTKYEAPYSATKGFNILLAEALFHEFRKQNIAVLACCAGMTETPTFRSAKPIFKGSWPGIMQPSEVAEFAFANLGRKPVCIPGWKNRLSYFILTRLLPRKMAGKIVSDSMDKIFKV